MEYKIGSFNMYKFSYQHDKEISKNYAILADLILTERFDILALQEVFNEGAIRMLVNRLGADWDFVWAQPISKSVQAQEGYAFVWNTRRFRLATGLKKEEANIAEGERNWRANKTFDPRIHDNYRNDRTVWHGGLVRDPLYARFESIQGWFEIRLINTHIMFSSGKDFDDATVSDAIKRQRELDLLIEIYKELADKQYRSTRPAYTFLLGDYNLNLPASGAKGPYIVPAPETTDRNGKVTKRIVTVQESLTTLKGKSHNAPDEPIREFANNYDHFTFDAIRFEKTRLYCDRIDSVHKYCGGDFEKHKKEVSDHIPIYICMGLT